MKFNSIKEYFYKLYNICYFITLIPLGVYIYLYLEMQSGALAPPPLNSDLLLTIQVGFIIFIILTLTSVHWVVRKKLGSILDVVSLGDRMDAYYSIALFRIGMGVVACSPVESQLWGKRTASPRTGTPSWASQRPMSGPAPWP